jgi:hypothetical protein
MGWVSGWFKKALFEDDDSIAYTLETGIAHSGNSAIRIKNKKLNDGYAIQDVPVLPDTVYRITCWINASGIEGEAGANISVTDSVAHSDFVYDTAGSWTQVELVGMTGQYQTKMKVAVRVGNWQTTVTGEALFDDMSIEMVRVLPAKEKMTSFTFNDEYSEDKGSAYIERISDIRLTSNRLFFSIILAFVMLAACALFTGYRLLILGRFARLDSFFRRLFTKWRYLLFASALVVFFIVWVTRSGPLTAFDIRFSFVLFFIAAIAIAFYLFKNKQLSKGSVITLVIFLGVAARICYFMYTAYVDEYSIRQHDIWGAWSHTDYIKYIAEHFALPPVGVNETYHPPVHYIASAVVFKVARLFGAPYATALQAVQVYQLFLSSLVIVFVNKVLKQLGCDENVRMIGVAVSSFLPSLVVMSAFMNNDTTVSFFCIVSLYYLIKWTDDPTVKNTVIVAIFTALSILSKVSALLMLAVAGIVFCVELYKHRQDYKKYLKLGLIFLAIAVPLGTSYLVRNYVLYQQGPSYTVPLTCPLSSNNPYYLLSIPVDDLLKHPFVPEDNSKRVFLVGELVRTALFDEYYYQNALPGTSDVASLVMLFFLVNLLLMVLYIFSSWKTDYGGKKYIMLVNFVLSILMFIQMHISSPYVMTYDYRYIAPFVSVSLAYFMAHANVKYAGSKYRVFRYIVPAQFVLWSALCVVFIISVGF